MAFNLKKVIKALLLSSSQPLSIKDIQAAFTRFHDEANQLASEAEEGEEGAPAASPAAEGTPAPAGSALASDEATPDSVGAAVSEAITPISEAGIPAAAPQDAAIAALAPQQQDPELYVDVPSLVTGTQIREAMDQIATELKASDDGVLLIEGSSGFRIVTHPRFGKWVRILRQEPPPAKLTQSAIETLAVIAYRQPVTKGEIETIRGVSAEAGVAKLLERELIYIVGRADAPGRPIQYGTTDQFLEFTGIKSLDELPASDVLSSRQIDEWLKTTSSTPAPTDTDMGLADEQLPLEAGASAPASAPAVEAAPASEDANKA